MVLMFLFCCESLLSRILLLFLLMGCFPDMRGSDGEASNADSTMSAIDSYRNRDETDQDSTADTNGGVVFDLESGFYKPTASNSSSPIPRFLGEEAQVYIRKRNNLQFDDSVFACNGGHFPTDNCVPSKRGSCEQCSRKWDTARVERTGESFVLRTLRGSAIQEKMLLRCICNNVKHWNPSDEFIHTIDHCREGAGYEVAFAFWNHLWGRNQEFSGIPIHMGHFRGLWNQSIKDIYPNADGFFKPKKWKEFITSATACRIMSTEKKYQAPCCSCDHLGGDGTAIGIPRKNVGHIRPAWKPEVESEQNYRGGRLARCGIPSYLHHSTEMRRDLAKARNLVLLLTDYSVSNDTLLDEREKLMARDSEYPALLGEYLTQELIEWITMEKTYPEKVCLRELIRAHGKEDSVTGIVHLHMLQSLREVLQMIEDYDCSPFSFDEEKWILNLRVVALYGMGPEIVRCLRVQKKSNNIRTSFCGLLRQLG